MILPEPLAFEVQGFAEVGFGLVEIAFVPQRDGQVVEAFENVGMPLVQRLASRGQGLAVELFGFVEVALFLEDPSQVVHELRHARVLSVQHF